MSLPMFVVFAATTIYGWVYVFTRSVLGEELPILLTAVLRRERVREAFTDFWVVGSTCHTCRSWWVLGAGVSVTWGTWPFWETVLVWQGLWGLLVAATDLAEHLNNDDPVVA